MEEIEQLYRDEADERLDSIEQGLLALEHGTAASDVIDGLFRDAHSLKGGAGMLGLDETYHLAHALEEVLGDVRARGELPRTLIDPMLRATDTLRRSVAGDVAGAVPAAEELARARAAVNGDAEGAAGDGARAEIDDAARPPDPAGAPLDPGPSLEVLRGSPERRTVRVDTVKVDRVLDAVGETILHHRRLEHALPSGGGGRELLDRGELLLDELQHAVVQLRMLPLASVAAAFPRGVRDLAAAQGKEVEFSFTGGETQLDRVILEGTADAISHLLRNAVAHGIEPPAERERAGKPRAASIWVRAEQRGDRAVIEVGDDGRGVAPELLRRAEATDRPLSEVLSEAGLSTAEQVSEMSGRGVGLDAVRAHVEAIGGSFELESEPRRGTAARLLLPVSVALLRVMLVERGSIVIGVPLAGIGEVLVADRDVSLAGRRAVAVRGEAVDTADLLALLGGSGPALPPRPAALVLGSRRRLAVLCDRIRGEAELIVKPLGPLLATTRGYLGAALLEDGAMALIADPGSLLSAPARTASVEAAREPERNVPTVLVVDDQFTVRELQRSILEAAGYDVQTARDGREAWELLRAQPRADVLVTDIEMPEMDGFDLLEAVRRDAELASLPVVIVSSRGREEDELRGLDAGADAYIVKERFDQQALLETVGRLIGR